jgi:hypothetical protein
MMMLVVVLLSVLVSSLVYACAILCCVFAVVEYTQALFLARRLDTLLMIALSVSSDLSLITKSPWYGANTCSGAHGV